MKHPFDSFHFCPKCGSSHFKVNDEKSKRCDDCGFVYYFNPSSAVVAVIVNPQHEVLVCRRACNPAKGTLDLPGGFCDCCETLEDAVAREVMEETGMTLTTMNYLFSLPNTYLYSNFLVHTVDAFFWCRVADDACPMAADDVAEVKWMPWSKLCTADFGLDSIRKGVENLLKQQQMTTSEPIK